MTRISAVNLRQLTYSYRSRSGGIVDALKSLSFDVAKGEFLVLVGPSGAGKSTLLHVLAGLLRPQSGTVEFPTLTRDRRVGYMFQNNATFPWRTVERNITYSLEIAGADRQSRVRRAVELCELVGLRPSSELKKYPHELSGGQVRRVALAMALANRPDVLLLDEPTSAVDWLTRRRLQATIEAVVTESGATVVCVTHDVEEAVWLSDRVIVLRDGLVAGSVDVNLDRPRTDDLRTTPAFKALEDQIIRHLGDDSQNRE